MNLNEYLININLALKGQDTTIAGLQKVNQQANNLSKQKITIFADKTGQVTGAQISGAIGDISDKTKKATPLIKQFGDAMRRALVVAPVWMILRGAMQAVFGLIGSQIQFLKDMESAMARIQIVGKGTEEEYKNLKTALIALSITYGVTASAALEAAKIFAQQGRTVQETFKLTRAAMIASQVLGTDIKTTVDDLTAAIEGFNVPVSQSISIIDKWINVERQFAVTSKDLAEATKTAGATANQLGITINSFLGDVTAVIELTRRSGSQAANALQFIYARTLTTGKKALEQIAQVPLYLDKQGKATFVVSENYRNISDILEELAGKWSTLTEKQKLDIAMSVASKRQLTSFMALMQNYNSSLDARIASLASAGAAERAFGIIQDTVAVKLERLTSSWNGLTSAVADTGAWKVSLDATTGLLAALIELVNQKTAIAIAGNKEKDVNQKVLETQKSQLTSIKELIQLRDTYLQRPPSDKNYVMLNKINTAIKNISDSSHLGLGFLDNKDTIDKLKIIDALVIDLEKREIRFDIAGDFDIRIKQLKSDLQSLQIAPVFIGTDFAKRQKEIESVTQEINNLEKNKTEEISKQINIYEIQLQNKKDIVDLVKQEEEANKLILPEEQTKIDIAQKLNYAKTSGVFTSQQLLDLEISLVQASEGVYEEYDKIVKLTELESERRIAILADYNKQLSLVESVAKLLDIQESSLIKQEMIFKSIMFGEDYIKSSMSDRLRLATAITQEMDNQEKKSAHLVDIYKISKQYGMGVAQEISNFLGGLTKFSDLSTQAVTAVRRRLPAQFEQETAAKALGNKIIFPEEIERQRKATRNLAVLNQIMVEPISVNVNLDSQGITAEILKKIAPLLEEEFNKQGSGLNSTLHKQIDLH